MQTAIKRMATTMARRHSSIQRSRSEAADDIDNYGEILNEFDTFGNARGSASRQQQEQRQHQPQRKQSRRSSTDVKNSSRMRSSSTRRRRSIEPRNRNSSRQPSVDKNHRQTNGSKQSRQTKSVLSEPTADGSSSSSSAADDDDDDEEDFSSRLDVREGATTPPSSQQDLKVKNKALVGENRRLQSLVDDLERQLAQALRSNTSTTTSEADQESITKMKGKIKSLKSKRKHDKSDLLKLQKSVDAHTKEIESLQRELGKSLTIREEMEMELSEAHIEIERYKHQLQESHVTKRIEQLETELQKRDGELEVTLELLQSKVERIIQLEYEVEHTKEQLQAIDMHRNSGNSDVPSFNHASIELMKADAECKSLRRQNMMLKLVVEELQEAHKLRSESDIDIDSVFMKLPKELQMGGMEASGSNIGGDDVSQDTDFVSMDTSRADFYAKNDQAKK